MAVQTPLVQVKVPRVPAVPVGTKAAGVAAAAGFPYWSRRVIVTVVVPPTVRMVSATVKVLCSAVAAPATTVVTAVSRAASVGLEAMRR